MDNIIYMNIGPIRFRYSAKEKAAEQGIDHFVIPRFTRAICSHSSEKTHINEMYELIRNNDLRNEQIIADVKECIKDNRTPVVLTKYKEHADILYKKLSGAADFVFLLTGAKTTKEQQAVLKEMNSYMASRHLQIRS